MEATLSFLFSIELSQKVEKPEITLVVAEFARIRAGRPLASSLLAFRSGIGIRSLGFCKHMLMPQPVGITSDARMSFLKSQNVLSRKNNAAMREQFRCHLLSSQEKRGRVNLHETECGNNRTTPYQKCN